MKPKLQIDNCLNYETTILKNGKTPLSTQIQQTEPKCLQCKFPTRVSDNGECLKMCYSKSKSPTMGCKKGEYCKVISEGKSYCHPAPANTNCKVFNSGAAYNQTGCHECEKKSFLDTDNKMCTKNCARFCKLGSNCEICGQEKYCNFLPDKTGTCKAPASLLPHCKLY